MSKPTKYICPECKLRAASGTVQCSRCQLWLHPKCTGITIEERKLQSEWYCLDCQSSLPLNHSSKSPMSPCSLPPGTKLLRSTPKSTLKVTTPKTVSKNQASQALPCADCEKYTKQLVSIQENMVRS